MKRCALCRSKKIDDVQYGEVLHKYGIYVHTFCLYVTSNLAQNGEDNDGFLGFLLPDIKAEVRRVSHLKCVYCGLSHANVGCCESRCHRTFHFICGLENGAENQFIGTYKSFCDRHVRKVQHKPHIEELCCICHDRLLHNDLRFRTVNLLRAPCCRNGWFHKLCLQKFAKTAGYFFKCPLCNDNNRFRDKLALKGIYVPDRDAAWELVPNAYGELLERPNQCTAEVCKNKRGRNDHRDNDFLYCQTCGSIAIHKCCFSNDAHKSFNCNDCRQFVSNDSAAEDQAQHATTLDSTAVDSDSDMAIVVCGESGELAQIVIPSTSNENEHATNASAYVQSQDKNLLECSQIGNHQQANINISRRGSNSLQADSPLFKPRKRLINQISDDENIENDSLDDNVRAVTQAPLRRLTNAGRRCINLYDDELEADSPIIKPRKRIIINPISDDDEDLENDPLDDIDAYLEKVRKSMSVASHASKISAPARIIKCQTIVIISSDEEDEAPCDNAKQRQPHKKNCASSNIHVATSSKNVAASSQNVATSSQNVATSSQNVTAATQLDKAVAAQSLATSAAANKSVAAAVGSNAVAAIKPPVIARRTRKCSVLLERHNKVECLSNVEKQQLNTLSASRHDAQTPINEQENINDISCIARRTRRSSVLMECNATRKSNEDNVTNTATAIQTQTTKNTNQEKLAQLTGTEKKDYIDNKRHAEVDCYENNNNNNNKKLTNDKIRLEQEKQQQTEENVYDICCIARRTRRNSILLENGRYDSAKKCAVDQTAAAARLKEFQAQQRSLDKRLKRMRNDAFSNVQVTAVQEDSSRLVVNGKQNLESVEKNFVTNDITFSQVFDAQNHEETTKVANTGTMRTDMFQAICFVNDEMQKTSASILLEQLPVCGALEPAAVCEQVVTFSTTAAAAAGKSMQNNSDKVLLENSATEENAQCSSFAHSTQSFYNSKLSSNSTASLSNSNLAANSSLLSSTAATASGQTPKRKRGRPLKLKNETPTANTIKIKRKRGRPFKLKSETPTADTIKIKRKRGRPFKLKSETSTADTIKIKRPRGRPSKDNNNLSLLQNKLNEGEGNLATAKSNVQQNNTDTACSETKATTNSAESKFTEQQAVKVCTNSATSSSTAQQNVQNCTNAISKKYVTKFPRQRSILDFMPKFISKHFNDI